MAAPRPGPLLRLVGDLWQGGQDLLWPRRCAECEVLLHHGRGLFCPECEETLVPLDPAASCPRCAAPLSRGDLGGGDLVSAVAAGGRCLDCELVRPVFQRVTAAYVYGGALATALRRFKWQRRDDLAEPLGALLAQPLRTCAHRCDVLVPVPLHRWRLLRRGYNQAALLCWAALRSSGVRLPLLRRGLSRVRADAPARDVDRAGRVRRVCGAFLVPRGQRRLLRGRRVLLCDDVLTTGATAHACALALLEAGAAGVEVLTLGRAGL